MFFSGIAYRLMLVTWCLLVLHKVSFNVHIDVE